MRTLLDASQVAPRDRLEFWCALLSEKVMPFHHKNIGASTFAGKMEVADFGLLQIYRQTITPMSSEATSQQIRQHYNPDYVLAEMVLSGVKSGTQSGSCFVNRPGDFMIYNNTPAMGEASESYSAIFMKLKRSTLQEFLGPISLYAGLTVRKEQASSILMRNYMRNLIGMHGSMNGVVAERASSIGIDLMIGSIAERLGQEQPKAIAGTLLVQRAKSYVDAHLSDPNLDASQLAIAMGVSLRRLQQLFREHNQNISDWIWRRRLALAASRLSDPASMFIQIGVIAYQCGFVSQSHFSNRFKDHYGTTPRDYREQFHVK